MCWSLQASLASFVAALWAPAALLWFLATADVPDAAARLCTAVVVVLVLPAFVQLGDTFAHLADREIYTVDLLPVAGWTYLVVALQPAVLAWGVVGCLQSGVYQTVLVLTGIGVVLHAVGCLAFDAPLTRWLTIRVVHREGSSMCAIVHGFFAYEGGCSVLFGLNARVLVYFSALLVACTGGVLAALELDTPGLTGPDDAFETRARVFVLLLALLLFVLLVCSVIVVNYFTLVRGHLSSVWCQLSLLSLLAMGFYLAIETDAVFAGVFLASTLAIWCGVFATVMCTAP